ncbi:MAG: hypothetical protein ACOYBP_08600 [Microbacteriaceae bacterium]
MTYSFGWTRHDLGLMRWFDLGQTTDDPRFALLSETWLADGSLLPYIAWCREEQEHSPLRGNGYTLGLSEELSPDLAEQLRAVTESPTRPKPWGCHLESGAHINGPTQLGSSTEFFVTNEAASHAVYIAGSAMGWYRGLDEVATKLGRPNQPSWKIEVFVKPFGRMGFYRKSGYTGLWYSGSDDVHFLGH